MDRPAIGHIVHYVLPNGQHRPAIIVHVWDKPSGAVNLDVFVDGCNDHFANAPVLWAHSILLDDKGAKGTWHWPERG